MNYAASRINCNKITGPAAELLLLSIRTLMPSAPPGGTAAEKNPGQGQYPDGDGNCIFAGGDHV
jgi:hypothetical protein